MTTYFALADFYTIGQEFETRQAALMAGTRKLGRLLEENETSDRLNHLRVAIDERVKDADGDRVVKRLYLSLEEA